GIFVALKEIVLPSLIHETAKSLIVRNAAGRIVRIELSHDPDVQINEEVGEETHRGVAIEIKGGSDVSNAHNRAGEAEKSHQKAKKQDFRDYWTIISLAGVDRAMLQQESPTTNSWFDVAQVLAREGKDWQEFRSRFAGAVGIPLNYPDPS